MNGVEILEVEQVAIVFKFNWIAFAVIVGIVALVFSIVAIASGLSIRNTDALVGLIVLGVILSLIFGGLAAIYFAKPIEYTNQYKVTVSDDVSMNEFMDRYEIIEQDGKIYTVRERD